MKIDLASLLTDPEGYVKSWLHKNANYPKRSAFAKMFLDYRAECAQMSIKAIDMKVMTLAYNLVLDEDEQRKLEETMLPFVCKKENLAPLKKWLKSVTGEVKQADLTAMSHWLWMIKRQGLQQDIIFDLFIILKGKQGGGKSTAVEKLVSPIRAAVLPLDADEMGDPNTYPEMATHLVVVLDELASLSRVDATKLKKQITAKENSYRPFYTQRRQKVAKRTSYIGTSNRGISQIFFDSTGMRRFYQINAKDTLDWKALGEIDYAELWRGIDETKERGYYNETNLEVISIIQESYVNKEDVEEYIAQNNLVPEGESYKLISMFALYQDYNLWSRNNGFRFQQTRIQFRRSLEAHGIPVLARSAGSIEQRVKINSKAAIEPATRLQPETEVVDFKERS